MADATMKTTVEFNAKDNASPIIDKVNKGIKNTEISANGLGKILEGYLTIQTAKMAYEFLKMGANAITAEKSFNNLTKSMDIDGDKLVGQLKKAARGLADDSDLMEMSTKALLVMGKDVSEQLPKMLEVAAASAKITGRDLASVYEDLITGINRQSDRMLIGIGISVDSKKANKEYAESLGKTAEQLTEAERRQAFMNEALKVGEENAKKVKDQNDTMNESFQRTEVAVKQMGENIAKFYTGIVEPIVKNIGTIVNFWNKIMSGEKLQLEDFKNTALAVADNMVLGVGTQISKLFQKEEESLNNSKQMMSDRVQAQRSMSEELIALREWEFANSGRILEQEIKEREDAQRILEAQQENTINASASFFGQMAAIAQQGGEQTLGIYKGLAIAETIISSLAGAQAALKNAEEYFGPAAVVMGPLMAAAQLATGAARVAAISSTSMNSSSVPSSSGGVSAPSAPTPSSGNVSSFSSGSQSVAPSSGGSGGGGGNSVNIYLTGATFMSKSDFVGAVEDIFKTAESQGYSVPKLDSVTVVE